MIPDPNWFANNRRWLSLWLFNTHGCNDSLESQSFRMNKRMALPFLRGDATKEAAESARISCSIELARWTREEFDSMVLFHLVFGVKTNTDGYNTIPGFVAQSGRLPNIYDSVRIHVSYQNGYLRDDIDAMEASILWVIDKLEIL